MEKGQEYVIPIMNKKYARKKIKELNKAISDAITEKVKKSMKLEK